MHASEVQCTTAQGIVRGANLPYVMICPILQLKQQIWTSIMSRQTLDFPPRRRWLRPWSASTEELSRIGTTAERGSCKVGPTSRLPSRHLAHSSQLPRAFIAVPVQAFDGRFRPPLLLLRMILQAQSASIDRSCKFCSIYVCRALPHEPAMSFC